MRVMAAALKGGAVSHFETRVVSREGAEVKVSFATSAVLAFSV